MRKRLLTTSILIALAIGGPAASAQEWQETPKPPKIAPLPDQKEKEKAKEKSRTQVSPPAPRPTPLPPDPDRPIEPLVKKVERGMKIGVTSRTVNVRITGWDKDTLHATASSENGPQPVEAEAEGGKINVYVPVSRVRRPSTQVTLEMKVPRYADLDTIESARGSIEISGTEASVLISSGTGNISVADVGALKLGSRGGNIVIRDVKTNIEVRNAHGNVTVEQVGGQVDLESTHGNVNIRNVSGDVRANSWLGNLELHCAKGRAELSSASGAIIVAGVTGDVEAKTTNGAVSFTGRIRNDGRYMLKSLSGQVAMEIQPDAPGFRVELNTYNGDIETAFPIKTEAPIKSVPINRFIKGAYKGGGNAQITLDSFSGGVRLVKATPEELKECK